MNYFAVDITGLPALGIILILLYVFLYLPLKLIMSLIAHAKQKADKLRLWQQRTVIAEYSPPNNLSPAEIGFLYDAKLNLSAIFATIVSLEQKGFITISENQNSLVVSGVKPATQELKQFEKLILDFLAKQTEQAITTKMLKKVRWQLDLAIKRQLQDEGYLVTTREQIKRSLLRLMLIMAGLIVLTVLAFRPHTLIGIGGLIVFVTSLAPFYFIVSVLLYARLKKIAGEPWLGTPRLKEVWSDIEGYHAFIKLVELDKLQFDSENAKAIIKNKTLPYAIALGFNTGWTKKI